MGGNVKRMRISKSFMLFGQLIEVADEKPTSESPSQTSVMLFGQVIDVAEQKEHQLDFVAESGVKHSTTFVGVSRHKRTGKFEAQLWNKNHRKRENGNSEKQKQIYLGGYATAEEAAKAYDLAQLKYFGMENAETNFQKDLYEGEMKIYKDMNNADFVAMLRRQSHTFSYGRSKYRGVTWSDRSKKWMARIGSVHYRKEIYLGCYETAELAAKAFDIAAIKYRGGNTVTNFDSKIYDVQKIKEYSMEVKAFRIGNPNRFLKQNIYT